MKKQVEFVAQPSAVSDHFQVPIEFFEFFRGQSVSDFYFNLKTPK